MVVYHALDVRPAPLPAPRLRVPATTVVQLAIALLALVVVPQIGSDWWLSAILIPWLILSLAGMGLNVLTGYAGQLSLGTAAFMAVGAFGAYNFLVRVPGLPLLVGIALGGVCGAVVGLVFGLPSLRLRGFYLIVATLAAQFFVQWALTKIGWFTNHSASGVISAPPLTILDRDFGDPAGRYQLTLAIVLVLTVLVSNLVRSPTGRAWMAVRDMEPAAAAMGMPILRSKLLAFVVSSFVVGVAGALWAFAYLGTVEPNGFDLDRSFQALFIVILGGQGSIAGPFLGAGFMVTFPILMDNAAALLLGSSIDPARLANVQRIVFGILIVLVLLEEPEGLAKLLRRLAARARTWPFRT